MRCEICCESIGNADRERWGPEFAHKTCVTAFKHGQVDWQETEREACATVCEGNDVTRAGGVWNTAVKDCATKIRMRSNIELTGASRKAKRPARKAGEVKRRVIHWS